MKKLLFFLFGVSLALSAQEFRVGSENTYKPFAYLDENNVATGFDNEVAKAVVAHIPNGTIAITSIPWNAIFSGLDSAKFDIVANQIAKTKEREAKYIFSKQPYFYGVSGLIVSETTKANDIKDLKGRKIGVSVGSNHAKNLEEYVKNNPKQNIKIVYYKTSPSLVADLANGRIAAMVNDPIAALDYAKAQNVKIKITHYYFEKTPVYFIFRKDSKQIADAFDQALAKAIEKGEISKLSLKYFGIDQTR